MTRPPSATREKLIETARDLFHQQGYAPTGIAQILKKSGVNSGSLYYFFRLRKICSLRCWNGTETTLNLPF